MKTHTLNRDHLSYQVRGCSTKWTVPIIPRLLFLNFKVFCCSWFHRIIVRWTSRHCKCVLVSFRQAKLRKCYWLTLLYILTELYLMKPLYMVSVSRVLVVFHFFYCTYVMVFDFGRKWKYLSTCLIPSLSLICHFIFTISGCITVVLNTPLHLSDHTISDCIVQIWHCPDLKIDSMQNKVCLWNTMPVTG